MLLLFSNVVCGQEEAKSYSPSSSLLSVFLSLIVVIAIIFALAYLARRFNVTQTGGGQMRVVASMMAGNKEKIMVVEVGDEQYLLGITAHNINHLATLDKALDNPQALQNSSGNLQANFQQKLVKAMAQTITGGHKNKTIQASKSEKAHE